MGKITEFRDDKGKAISSIIDTDDFIKMLARMKEKGYNKLVYAIRLNELSISDDDIQYNIDFCVPTCIFKGNKESADIDKILSDDIMAMMLLLVKGDKIEELNAA